MAQFVTSVKNTFVHVDVDSPDCVEMGNARRRESSAPARVTLNKADNEKKYHAHATGAQDIGELMLLPHDDDDDYASMHAHPGPSPLDMDVEGLFGCHVPEMDVDDDVWGLSMSQAKDEAATDFVEVRTEVVDTATEETEEYSASAPAYQGLTYGAQLPDETFRESPSLHLPCLSTAPMTPHALAQRQLFSTFPLPPNGAQRDSNTQSYPGNSPARVLDDAKHEETQGAEKRTTVMLMNVPLRYTSSKLMCTIDGEGFASMYDFIYVPMTAARNSKGYAFVNLVNPSIAQRFLKAFEGFSRWSAASKNVGHAVWAKQHQGLQTNIDRYRNSTVLGKTVPDEYKPRIFENGVEVPFPAPTRKPSTPMRRVDQPRKNKTHWTLSL